MAGLTPDKVVEAYVSSRADIKTLEDQIEKIKEVQRKREEWLLGQLQTQGLQNMKTMHGTVYQTLRESVTVGDWDSLLGWVREGERFEYLNKAVNKTAVLELMGEKREDVPPPGVNYSAAKIVGIRKG